MFIQPVLDRRQRRVGKIMFQIAPDPGQEFKVTRLAITGRQPRENADDLYVALCAENGVGGAERAFLVLIEAEGSHIAGNHRFRQRGIDIAARIFQQRHQVVGRIANQRILKVQQPHAPDALAFRQPR